MGFLRCPALPGASKAVPTQGWPAKGSRFLPHFLGFVLPGGISGLQRQPSPEHLADFQGAGRQGLGDPNQATHSLIRAPLKRMGGGGAGGGRRLSSNRMLQQQPAKPDRQKGPLLPQCLATNQSLT